MPRILGIDPGSRCCGYGVIEHQGEQVRYIASGVIRLRPIAHAARLVQLFDALRALIAQHAPDEAAVEQVFVCKNVASALKLGQARGAILVACGAAGLPIGEYAPRAIKQAVAGYGHADKAQIQSMMRMLLKLPALPQSDAADALAVAWCHQQHQRLRHYQALPET